MAITKSHFGHTAEGIAIECYRLTNSHGHHVSILTYGGIIQSLHVPDQLGQIADVVLGFDTLAPYLEEHPYFGAIIGRYANRIAQGQFSLDGHHYQLATNNGPNHLHGGTQGFDKQVWQASIEELADVSCLILRRISPDGEEGYPGTLSVEVRYTWNDSNALRIDYLATTDASTILNLTNHSYFNLAGFNRADAQSLPSILNHRMQLHADRYLPVNETLIPTGEMATVTNTSMDFRTPVSIGELLDVTQAQIRYANQGYDHAWLLNQNQDALESLPLAATVHEPACGRFMRVYTSQPAMQFYTGNFLDGSLLGKGNFPYHKHAAFCLETQHYPDAPNHPEFPSTVLRPGAIYRQATIYEFSFA